MHTQNPVRLLFNDELDKSLGIEIRLSSRIGEEREFSNFILDTGCFEFLFGFADPGDFGVGVHDRGDRFIVDMTMAGFDDFGSGNA